jgi:hypothetical protein
MRPYELITASGKIAVLRPCSARRSGSFSGQRSVGCRARSRPEGSLSCQLEGRIEPRRPVSLASLVSRSTLHNFQADHIGKAVDDEVRRARVLDTRG